MKKLLARNKTAFIVAVGVVILSGGLYVIHADITQRNALLQKQVDLEQAQVDASKAATNQQHYDSIRAGCVAEQNKTQQDLNDFLNTCQLGSTDACLSSPAGKILVSGLKLQALQDCINRNL